MSLAAIIIFIFLTLIGAPLAITSGVGAGIALEYFSTFPSGLMMLMHRMVGGIDSYTLLAIPLFILCGNLMNAAQLTNRIFNLAQALVGHITGGLGHANVVASMIFAGMSGSATADAGGLGTVEIKAMLEYGYDRDFAVSITAASSTIGPIIPPSIIMILYAAMTEESVGRLFLGGFVPGILMGFSLMITVYIISRKRGYGKTEKQTFTEILKAFHKALLSLLTPVIIVGGIAVGVFTVTEAAAVAALYAFILGGLVYKHVKIRDLTEIILDTMRTTAVIMFILSTIAALAWILVSDQVAKEVGNLMLSITHHPQLILLMIVIFLLVFGCVLEAIPIMILTVPIFMPVIETIGIDPIHFGVVMVLVLMIGLITPPVGMILFVISEIGGVSVERVMKTIIPFIIPLLCVLTLIAYIPDLVLAVPNWIFGN